ncbi:hypothetical protein D088_970050 [Salmonella enterica subsp. houtenae serovar 16:z4,z32:-- str. RKS3027]|nr:hypothetical protein D088_970050 [Salmonella enterica subsp. houtenae serovar 16:z4,z32:-- str. RKS3027]
MRAGYFFINAAVKSVLLKPNSLPFEDLVLPSIRVYDSV